MLVLKHWSVGKQRFCITRKEKLSSHLLFANINSDLTVANWALTSDTLVDMLKRILMTIKSALNFTVACNKWEDNYIPLFIVCLTFMSYFVEVFLFCFFFAFGNIKHIHEMLMLDVTCMYFDVTIKNFLFR